LLRHVDVRTGGRRVARRVVVNQITSASTAIILLMF
jgi:hypothetical protein